MFWENCVFFSFSYGLKHNFFFFGGGGGVIIAIRSIDDVFFLDKISSLYHRLFKKKYA